MLKEIRNVFNDWVARLLPISKDLKILQRGIHGLNAGNAKTVNSDAVFLAWQKTPEGELFALYNVTAKQHPLYGSTVSEETLRKQQLKIPPAPFPQGQLKRLDFEK